ncbi:MAG: tryptophan synthase subunit alpha [Sedimenticola sp.]|nr:tryptophan synthase subunit alpha [Sedimenticola sp.]MCW8882092.1 tryptophan synthase subunit alpha [Sedimenticola sp.]MCW8947034.1 tryptophan synthase subunit alpha [Sedimenticola sp.]MCW8974788.1 tryptophan synthase subunit alpha [Sedimenticola sp.]MCW9021732.1 tryptophan synthase subunit alpha [Sedimenticola sp.]
MSRIGQRFKQLEEQSRVALIPFVTAGDPNPAITVPLMHAMVEAGADIIELGVPFSDPMADGPVIQRASERALEHGVSLRDVLGMVSQFRASDTTTPVVLMGYLNPVEVMGYEAFAEAAAEAGVDGLLTVDLPPEEADDLLAAIKPKGIDPIFLIAPTTTDERMQRICDAASGFVYYVSVKGITGASHLAIGEVAAKTAQIRKHTTLPVGVGFGISSAEKAQAVAQVGDAVIVGSVLVKRIEELNERPDEIAPAIAQILSAMRQAIDLV